MSHLEETYDGTSPTGMPLEHAEFLRLFTTHQRQVHGYIGSVLANPADVEEVLQETSIVLWSKFEQFDRERPFLPWACGIAHLQILRFFRMNRRQMIPLDEPTIEALLAERSELAPKLDERRGALKSCLKKLPGKDRQLVEQCYSPGASFKQIAERLGRPVNAVYQSLGRIRRRLHECIDRTVAEEARP